MTRTKQMETGPLNVTSFFEERPSGAEEASVAPFDVLKMYLVEIKRFRLLTRDEERALAARVREQEDDQAAQVLVTSNLRLVVKIVMNFRNYWKKSLLDLIQEGNLGLLQAVRKFDPYRNIKFSYYAAFWIKAYVLKFIMDNWKLVKIGTTQPQRKLFFNLAKEKQALIAQGVNPEPRLLAERLDVKEEEVIQMSQRLGGWDVSLDAPSGGGHEEHSKEPFSSVLPDPEERIDDRLASAQRMHLLSRELASFRKTLDGKKADIFDYRIMSEQPLTLQQLGDRHGISRERVRQIQEEIICKAKEWLHDRIPKFSEEFSDLPA